MLRIKKIHYLTVVAKADFELNIVDKIEEAYILLKGI